MKPTDPSAMSADAFHAGLAAHESWRDSGLAMLRSSDLIWPKVFDGFLQLHQHAAAVREASGGGMRPNDERLGMIVTPPILMDGLKEFSGYCNAYLMNAGYAVENLLKAVRIKRLVLAGRKIEFGNSPNQVPSTHTYEIMARRELGTLSAEETVLLRRLSLYTRWAGRYPMAKEPPPLIEANGRAIMTNDRESIHAVCQRLTEKYESLK
ncbi:MAG TPA: hypothetical protein VGY48_30365 [Vicinamibacterales bacterium]|jgi:hypothetical protein|nr:hypothetical protein [Vicinamibacterales bacterium]